MHETAVIGAGLAGLLLVRNLLDRGVEASTIALIDAGGDERASDVPSALMHPFPGRSMKPKKGQLTSAKTSIDVLRELGGEIGDEAVVELEMVRPLLGELGEKLRASWEEMRGDYPDWFDSRIADARELEALDPNLAHFDEALVYRPAFSVDTAKLRSYLRDQFRQAGVALIDQTQVDRLRRVGDSWRLVLGPPGEELGAKTVILASGWGMKTWFPKLAIRGRGGEVLVARPPEGAPLRCIVNASGHVAPGAGGTWVAGSTYWAPEEFDERTDDEALTQLLERCARLTPPLERAEPVRIWRGIRAMYRGDNRPLVGALPEHPDLFVFGGLGSKGLLRIPELAAQLAALLLDGEPIDERATTARVKPAKWQSARIDAS